MLFLLFLLILRAVGIKLPDSCGAGQYYDSIAMDCRFCNGNSSMIPAADGFGCKCSDDTIRIGISRCRSCHSTELISADGTACVPRRCQKSGGRVVCRKCPNDYIAVTQNFDGSPMKEVTCFKCSRGYKAEDNKCVKCEACSCGRNEIAVGGKCLPKKYVMGRPKYSANVLHPSALLDIVKLEYLCTQSDMRACHALSRECVRYLYSTDLAGPCRLWIQPNLVNHTSLPPLYLDLKNRNNEIDLKRGKNTILIATAVHSHIGGLKLLEDDKQVMYPCLPPLLIKIGERYKVECTKTVSDLEWAFGKLYELYIPGDNFKPLTISLVKPDGHYIQKGPWPSLNFRKYFLMDNILSTTTNISAVIFMRKLLLTLRIERNSFGSLSLYIHIEAQFATKPLLSISQQITTTLIVEHEMPTAGVLHGLEIWGGIFGTLLCLYALIQWRGKVRRGAFQICIIPLISSAVADGLYFATIITTLHALAAEAGTLGITLPLSQTEDNIITAVIYSVIALKIVKLIWMNWRQCRSDVFYVDWSEYNPPVQDPSANNNSFYWRSELLSKEWMEWQTKRRVSPLATVVGTLSMLLVLESWQSYIPKGHGYTWVVATVVWWFTYITIFSINWIKDRFFKASTRLIKVCCGVELSLLVFEEEYYAHYVHGRNEESDGVMRVPGPLASCRVVCASQVRTVYKKLATTGNVLYPEENKSNRILLSRFLSAFFERALDGLHWVASERTILERLLDVEIINREGSNISSLLYDVDETTPSCLAVTWWGEEWTLATFDSMLFGCILLATSHTLIAALVVLLIWQIMKQVRFWFAYKNLIHKIGVQV